MSAGTQTAVPEVAETKATAEAKAPTATPRTAARGAPLLAHSYDGIQEYDNPLPGWWSAIFYGSIAFAVGYWIWFHAGGPGQSELAEYRIERKAYDDQQANQQALAGTVSEMTVAARAADPTSLAAGKAVFLKYCASCHTESGKGQVGPNLTDEFQKHGATRVDIFTTVNGGITGTAMPPWGLTLKGDELLSVVAFVTTLRGTNVPDGKAAEGERVERFESAP